jgi:hypothetical protein
VQKPDCWIDIFELSHYRGRRRRLFGPMLLHSLRCRLPAWGVSMDSAITGPEAYVRFFSAAEPNRTALWLLPRQLIGDLVQRVADSVDSLHILDAPPAPGDVGYDLFRLQIKQTDPGSIVPGSASQPDLDRQT